MGQRLAKASHTFRREMDLGRWPDRGWCALQREAALAAAHVRLRIGVHGFSPGQKFCGCPCRASTTEVRIGGNRRALTWTGAERHRCATVQVFRDDKKNSRRLARQSPLVFGVDAAAIGMGAIYEGIWRQHMPAFNPTANKKNRQPSRVCRLRKNSLGGISQPGPGPYQPSAATAALKVLLGRITASSLAASGW